MNHRCLWKRLWQDEVGGLLSTEYILLGSLLTLGLIVGLASIKTSIDTELDDYAEAVKGIGAGEFGPATTFVGNEGGTN